MNTAKRILQDVLEGQIETMLRRAGLERRGGGFQRMTSTFGIVAFGIALGAGVTYVLTSPQARDVRVRLGDRAQRVGESLTAFSHRMKGDAPPAPRPSNHGLAHEA